MSVAFGNINGGTWSKVTVVASSEPGKSLLHNQDGTTVSVQPDGSVQSRPGGADGPYEQCEVAGQIAKFCPDDTHVYPFALV